MVHVQPEDLIKDWGELLNLRQPGFKWDGSSGVDLDMRGRLAVNAAPLMQILKHAPSGFPAHGDLANVFASLQASHGIVDESKKPMPKACTDAAETWRLLAKEVYKLKKNGEQCAPIQDLIDSIVLPSSQSASIHSDIVEDTATCGLTAPEVQALFSGMEVDDLASGDEGVAPTTAGEGVIDSDDDCQIVFWPCACPKCVGAGHAATTPSVAIPSSVKGGQRLETTGSKRKVGEKRPAQQQAKSASKKLVTDLVIQCPALIVWRHKPTEKKAGIHPGRQQRVHCRPHKEEDEGLREDSQGAAGRHQRRQVEQEVRGDCEGAEGNGVIDVHGANDDHIRPICGEDKTSK